MCRGCDTGCHKPGCGVQASLESLPWVAPPQVPALWVQSRGAIRQAIMSSSPGCGGKRWPVPQFSGAPSSCCALLPHHPWQGPTATQCPTAASPARLKAAVWGGGWCLVILWSSTVSGQPLRGCAPRAAASDGALGACGVRGSKPEWAAAAGCGRPQVTTGSLRKACCKLLLFLLGQAAVCPGSVCPFHWHTSHSWPTWTSPTRLSHWCAVLW